MMFKEYDLVGMGYIKSAYGLKGWVNIKFDTERSDSLLDYSNWYLCKGDLIKEVKILDSKALSNTLRVKIVGIENRAQAQLLSGMEIKIPRKHFKDLSDNEYYWVDLIGLEVRNLNNIFLGKVRDLIKSGSNDILVINSGKKDILIPFVSIYIVDVNLVNKKIISDWELDY